MNIFVLDNEISKSAAFYNDSHVRKIIIEIAQLCSNAHWSKGLCGPYKQTHKSHPLSHWITKSINNYKWAVSMGLELCKEYTHRYGKAHKTYYVLQWLKEHQPCLPDIPITPFYQAMPDKYRSNDAVMSYRAYYLNEKRHLAKWKNREKPYWWQ